ncbi:long-subunit acyl-CoA synthetase (AMP-forming) [Actinocorallia herbida]|uniref:Long-subunit acyl-CoA synthetase (AMP-forming) n=1 Tax=Actinocorallia herbida TaxID=58109 RepID=A0A3N1DBC3_9ACTN|nr:AMP-binding protein [Actinocorallia herbida]ROO90823.1 long-subunit acyl-CoA synthetase (AMP-forming) [Actinocorallia herbida]
MPPTDGPGLAGLVARLAELPDAAVHHLEGTTLVRRPYPEVHRDVVGVRDGLSAVGVKAGTRVGLWGANSYQWLVHELALLDLGCVTVTLPVAELAGHDPAALAERFGLELLIADEARYGDAARPSWMVPMGGTEKAEPRDAADPLDPGVFSIVFSSGTTGTVKAIQIDRRATEDCLAEFGRHHAFRPDDSILVCLPLSTFQQRIMYYCAFWYGFDAVVVEPSPLMFAVLKQARPTIMGGPPAFYELVESRFAALPAPVRSTLRGAARAAGALPAPLRRAVRRRLFAKAHEAYGGRMRLMLSGSAPLRRSTAELFGLAELPLFQLYGLTESGFIAWNRPDANRIGSVGRPVFPGSVSIADDGEVLVRWPRPQSPGYLGEPPEVQRAAYLEDGTVATGDLGRLDDDGFLYLTGRKKDLIITRAGHKIAPAPLEQRILADADVAQAVLVGGGDLAYVGAVVALRPHAGDSAVARVRAAVAEVNRDVPEAGRILRVLFTRDDFTRENGLMTTTLKIDRAAVARRYRAALDAGELWYP